MNKSILTRMLEWFTLHPQSHGMSYWQHLKFAWSVAAQLVMSVTVFGLHGIVPAFKIPKSLDFEATIYYLECKNKEVEIYEVAPSS